MDDQRAVEVSELARTFTTGPRRDRRTVEAVRAMSFSVDRGERLAFIGPNGAGKSTSIKMLTGILRPTTGCARVLGLIPWEQRKELARHIGTLFGQRSQLWTELAPRVSYRMLGAIFGLSDHEIDLRVAELGEVLDAEDLFDQPVRTHSLGQRMRCELAASLLHRPELLFLDEPTIGLDLLAKQRFRELLLRINLELGTTVFLTSHDVADIEYVAERAIVVNHGSIIHDSPVARMREDLLATKRVDIGLETPADADSIRSAIHPSVVMSSPSPVLVRLEVDTSVVPVRELLDSVLAAVRVTDLTVVDPPLEQVIGEIYERPA